MTRVFTEDGTSVPVTVVEADPNRITQIRELDRDGYAAIQVTTGSRRASLVNQPSAGHYRTAGVEPGEGLWEFRLDGEDGDFEVGGEITVERFTNGQKVDVTGTSKGKGFAGTMKRHGFRGQGASHGAQAVHRRPGSIGGCATPGRVFKGKKMAGRMGNRTRTVQCALVYKVDPERNLLWIKGQVPGKAGNFVRVKDALFKSPADQGLEVPYPAWGMGDMPEAPTEVTVAKMKDPFLTQGSVADAVRFRILRMQRVSTPRQRGGKEEPPAPSGCDELRLGLENQ